MPIDFTFNSPFQGEIAKGLAMNHGIGALKALRKP